MENFILDDSYLVGDYLLDAQHKAILGYMAKVYTTLIATRGIRTGGRTRCLL